MNNADNNSITKKDGSLKEAYKKVVYRATNLQTGSVYIGSTIKGLEDRRKRHLMRAFKPNDFRVDLRKHGMHNFKWEIIDTATNAGELRKKETALIKEHQRALGVEKVHNKHNKGMQTRNGRDKREQVEIKKCIEVPYSNVELKDYNFTERQMDKTGLLTQRASGCFDRYFWRKVLDNFIKLCYKSNDIKIKKHRMNKCFIEIINSTTKQHIGDLHHINANNEPEYVKISQASAKRIYDSRLEAEMMILLFISQGYQKDMFRIGEAKNNAEYKSKIMPQDVKTETLKLQDI